MLDIIQKFSLIFHKEPKPRNVAEHCWAEFKGTASPIPLSPFIVCLHSGTICKEALLNCIAQDVYILEAFLRLYETAEIYAEDEEKRKAIRKLGDGVKETLDKQKSIVTAESNSELPNEYPCDDQTKKYIETLLILAEEKVQVEGHNYRLTTPFDKTRLPAYILGAIIPHMSLYAFQSYLIRSPIDPDEVNPIFLEWIHNYTNNNYVTLAFEAEELLDVLSVSLTSDEMEVVEKLYHQSLQHEVDFFFARPVMQPTVFPFFQFNKVIKGQLILFCDFDSTCAVHEDFASNEALEIAKLRLETDGSESSCTSMAELGNTLLETARRHREAYEQILACITQGEQADHFAYNELIEALRQLADFVKMANSRVLDSRVLKGLNLEEIKQMGKRIIFKNGCREFLEKTLEHRDLKTDVNVVSCSWCGDMIKSAFSSGDLSAVNVHSNYLAYEDSISTGEVIITMETAFDKFQAYKTSVQKFVDNGNRVTVYVGGTASDLLCLLHADIGIVVNTTPSLKKLGSQFGVSFLPLSSGLVRRQKELVRGDFINWRFLPGTVYEVSNWSDIQAFILGSP